MIFIALPSNKLCEDKPAVRPSLCTTYPQAFFTPRPNPGFFFENRRFPEGISLWMFSPCRDDLTGKQEEPAIFFRARETDLANVIQCPSMHELSLMTNLLDSAVAAGGGAPIHALRVRVGPLSGVVVDSLRFAFEALSPGTVAEGARLDIEETALSFHCLKCAADYETPLGSYECPACGAADGELRGGHELELVSIEVPDHV